MKEILKETTPKDFTKKIVSFSMSLEVFQFLHLSFKHAVDHYYYGRISNMYVLNELFEDLYINYLEIIKSIALEKEENFNAYYLEDPKSDMQLIIYKGRNMRYDKINYKSIYQIINHLISCFERVDKDIFKDRVDDVEEITDTLYDLEIELRKLV